MFSEVQKEESHRLVMMGDSSSTIHENSTFVVTKVVNVAASVASNIGGQGISKKAWGNKAKIWRDHCNK